MVREHGGKQPQGTAQPRFDSRIEIKMTSEGRAKIDKLVARVDMEDVSAVVRDAMRVYDIITKEFFVDGNQILVREAKSGEIMRLVCWPEEKQSR